MVVEGGYIYTLIFFSRRPVNHLGRPLRERWMFIAFCLSEQTEKERNKAIAAEYR